MIQYLYLGRVEYDQGLRLQAEIAAWRYQGRVGNVLLLLEHPPVLTLGRNADRANVLASAERLAVRGVTLHQTNRGGDVTYHGPGQLVGYSIFDLRSMRTSTGARMGPVDFVRRMEEVLIRVCGTFGLRSGRIAGLTGVWCGCAEGDPAPLQEVSGHPELTLPLPRATGPAPERKIAAIGIHVSRGITSHGFAFNVSTDLRDFSLINPCGITDKPVTSLEVELSRAVGPGKAIPALEQAAHEAARQFGMVFDEQILAVASIEALRAQAEQAPQLPAQDTPLSIPAEIRRLRGETDDPQLA